MYALLFLTLDGKSLSTLIESFISYKVTDRFILTSADGFESCYTWVLSKSFFIHLP